MKDCVVCHHSIDDQAKICVFCNSDPETGERFDTKPLLDEHFSKKKDLGPTESALEFFRQRQALVVFSLIGIAVLALFALHRWNMMRNAAAGAGEGIPLTEVADVNSGSSEPEVPMPQLDFQYAGNPRSMRTYTLEPGAIPPPEVVQQQVPAGTPAPAAAATPMLPRREQTAAPQQQFQPMQGLPLGMPPLNRPPPRNTAPFRR